MLSFLMKEVACSPRSTKVPASAMIATSPEVVASLAVREPASEMSKVALAPETVMLLPVALSIAILPLVSFKLDATLLVPWLSAFSLAETVKAPEVKVISSPKVYSPAAIVSEPPLTLIALPLILPSAATLTVSSS